MQKTEKPNRPASGADLDSFQPCVEARLPPDPKQDASQQEQTQAQGQQQQQHLNVLNSTAASGSAKSTIGATTTATITMAFNETRCKVRPTAQTGKQQVDVQQSRNTHRRNLK